MIIAHIVSMKGLTFACEDIMKNKKKIFVVKSPDNMQSLYGKLLKKRNGGSKKGHSAINYEYCQLSMEELALLAKKDPYAMSEILTRMHSDIAKTARCQIADKAFLLFDEVCARLEHTLVAAVEIYDPNKGSFLHLYRKMAKINIQNMSIKTQQTLAREKKYFGTRIPMDAEDVSFLREGEELTFDFAYRALGVDWKNYLASLDSKSREMLLLYMDQFPITEIAKIEDINYSTAASQIYALIKRFKKLIEE